MEAKIVQKSPFPVDVESGKTYYYCTCGLSENQPFVMVHIKVQVLAH